LGLAKEELTPSNRVEILPVNQQWEQESMYRHHSLPTLLVLLCVTGACTNTPAKNDDTEDSGIGSAPCDLAFEGNYLIGDQEDLNDLATYCEVTGHLTVYNTSLTSLTIPQITEVGGDVSVTSNASLTSLTIPNLSSVGGSLIVESNATLTSFELPALTEVGEGEYDNVSVKHNDALTSFDLSALARVSDSLFVRFDSVLSAFDLSALTRLEGYLGVTDNDALAQCLVEALVAQVEAGEGIGKGVDPTGGPNNPLCTCEEVEGVLQANCP